MKINIIILPLLAVLVATAAPLPDNSPAVNPENSRHKTPDPVLLPPQNLVVASADPQPIPGQPNLPQRPSQVPNNKFIPAHTNYYTDPPEKFPPALTNRPPWSTNQPSWPTNRPPWSTNHVPWPTNRPHWNTNQSAWPTNRPPWHTNASNK